MCASCPSREGPVTISKRAEVMLEQMFTLTLMRCAS